MGATKIKVSPSSLDRGMKCSGSMVKSAEVPEQPAGKAAVRGTQKHLALNIALLDGMDHVGEMVGDGALQSEDQPAIEKAVRQIMSLWGNKIPDTLEPEKKFDLEFWGIEKTGRENEHQADYVWIGPKRTGMILDYKSGKTPVPPPGVNFQLLIYAAAYAKENKLTELQLHICQPEVSEDIISSEVISVEMVDRLAGFAKEQITNARKGIFKFNPSQDACSWCPGQGSCEAFQSWKQEGRQDSESQKAEALSLVKGGELIQVEVNIEGPIIVLDSAAVKNARDLETKVGMISEVSSENVNECGELLSVITKFEKYVDEQRTLAKKPVLDLGRALDAAAKDALEPLSRAKTGIKRKLEAFLADQSRKAQEAAASAPKGSAPMSLSATTIKGIKTKKVKIWEIVNEKKIPAKYVQKLPNKALIDAAVEDGQIEIGTNEWIKVWTEDRVQSK